MLNGGNLVATASKFPSYVAVYVVYTLMCALAEKTADPPRKETKKHRKDSKKEDSTELNPLAVIKTLLAKQEAMEKELAK
eukprot:1713789-Rhodomonas_salina.1